MSFKPNPLEPAFKFVIRIEEVKKLSEWKETHRCRYRGKTGGAIGGKITYCFTPTTIGTIIRVECACGKDIDLTDYDGW
ncbi:MAG: hypothetical protein A2745_01335 [Candidatus Harrisonbacteria bacterium RIFCSPHIGHO2_01_FULL_44_13]|uniref:Uncharacterized protein n=1 Tax=Candidatus Harrisonbacteria bacterium RIFCSPLOWO2_01_FULL_44_18 TaxID=1798407 RepID=A0A1G1ZNK2_9BACT|nr:MAG: hypothetical protein A2745_01335 [Candidatus Harrisonbacteria bacterium RIFCSPHIGHO2_01_FULL_44_13]OGY66142.1 MAG: hypothetical protein A3A16_02430 [Candidatus Harrisonbacteria bacterium RIFCSPLOWO2_01_FULL_44_18]